MLQNFYSWVTCNSVVRTVSTLLHACVFYNNFTCTDFYTCLLLIAVDKRQKCVRRMMKKRNISKGDIVVSSRQRYVEKRRTRSRGYIRDHQGREIGDKKFKRKRDLVSHRYDVVKDHECSECHKRFSCKSHLQSHMVTHSKIKRHECEVCHKKFGHRDQLTRHMITHTKIKRHECEVCHKKFGRRDQLTSHMVTHAKIKRHECEVCHKKFGLRNELTRHMITHTKVKAHECEQCHSKFSLKQNLQRHMATHTKIKRHECEVCHKKFARRDQLPRHMITHTKVKAHAWMWTMPQQVCAEV